MSAARPARFGYALGERRVPLPVSASRRPNRPAPAATATATAITTITTITAAATITTITAVGAPSLASSSCRPTIKARHHRG